jgi:hypothetical protein
VGPQERGVEAVGAVLERSFPGWAFNRSIAPTMSGPSSVAFQLVSVSEREATYLGMVLIRSK